MKDVISKGFKEKFIKKLMKNNFVKTNAKFFTLKSTTKAILEFMRDGLSTKDIQEIQNLNSTLLDEYTLEYLIYKQYRVYGMFQKYFLK